MLETRRSALDSCAGRLLPPAVTQWLENRAGADAVSEERFWSDHAAASDPAFRIAPPEIAARLTLEEHPRVLRHGLGSEVRLRPRREARAWGDVETRFLRLSHRVAG